MSNLLTLVKAQGSKKRYNRSVFEDLKQRERMRSKLKQLDLSRSMIVDMLIDFKSELDEIRRDFEFGDYGNQGGVA